MGGGGPENWVRTQRQSNTLAPPVSVTMALDCGALVSGEHPQGASVDSTHFDERSPNPLYSDDLHFPVNAELKMSFESDYFGQTPEGASVCYMPPVARGSSINS